MFAFHTILLTIFLPMSSWIGHNTDMPSNCNISKTVRVNNSFTGNFLKKYLVSFLMILKLIEFALAVL